MNANSKKIENYWDVKPSVEMRFLELLARPSDAGCPSIAARDLVAEYLGDETRYALCAAYLAQEIASAMIGVNATQWGSQKGGAK